jgi:hypothetical protein
MLWVDQLARVVNVIEVRSQRLATVRLLNGRNLKGFHPLTKGHRKPFNFLFSGDVNSAGRFNPH